MSAATYKRVPEIARLEDEIARLASRVELLQRVADAATEAVFQYGDVCAWDKVREALGITREQFDAKHPLNAAALSALSSDTPTKEGEPK